jgi:hypothetical protein
MTDARLREPVPGPEPAWPDQATDLVETVVTTVRDRAVVPVQRATGAVVFGVLAACFVIPALIFGSIALFRLVDVYLPGEVWATWLLFGGIFLVAGLFLWIMRKPRTAQPS